MINFKKINFNPSKKLGQNFINDSQKAEFIVKSLKLKDNENILEIGPGFAALSEFLVLKAKKLVLIEKDRKIYDFLKRKFAGKKEIEIFNDDILKFNCELKLKNHFFKVVSNLPFSSATKILEWCFENKDKFTDLYLSFAEEVALKILNNKKSNFLNMLCQSHSEFKQILFLEPFFFTPQPKVNTIFIHFKLNSQKSIFSDKNFQFFIRKVFSNKRKTLLNNLKKTTLLDLQKLNILLKEKKIPLNIRAEDLNLNFFIEIYKTCFLKKIQK